MNKPSVVIVSPGLADANNGNWQTAWRWRRMLAPRYRVRIVSDWLDARDGKNDGDANDDAIMLALHARRSAASIDAWHRKHGNCGLAVVLTGTDLYRDIQDNALALRSLDQAGCLVVLQERGLDALPDALRGKARAIFQSTTARPTLPKTRTHLRAIMVGHLREEKSPETLFTAARLLASERDILIDHVGAALEPGLGAAAQATALANPGYRWLGGQRHESVRRRIQRAHVLVHTSRMEGGAHVIMEAIVCGTPVIASRVSGNVGMLGADYEGYFAHGDAAALAAMLVRCRDELMAGDDSARLARSERGAGEDALLRRLQAQCALRAPLFAPAAEQASLHELVAGLVRSRGADAGH